MAYLKKFIKLLFKSYWIEHGLCEECGNILSESTPIIMHHQISVERKCNKCNLIYWKTI